MAGKALGASRRGRGEPIVPCRLEGRMRRSGNIGRPSLRFCRRFRDRHCGHRALSFDAVPKRSASAKPRKHPKNRPHRTLTFRRPCVLTFGDHHIFQRADASACPLRIRPPFRDRRPRNSVRPRFPQRHKRVIVRRTRQHEFSIDISKRGVTRPFRCRPASGTGSPDSQRPKTSRQKTGTAAARNGEKLHGRPAISGNIREGRQE